MDLIELPRAYMNALAGQFGFHDAFLGAISITLFVTLPTISKPAPVLRWSIILAGFASLAFIVTASLSVGVFSTSHPNTPAVVAGNSVLFEQLTRVLNFSLGIFALLAAIRLSGWHRLRSIGIALSAFAIMTLALSQSRFSRTGAYRS